MIDRNRITRMLALLMALALVPAVVPATAFAAADDFYETAPALPGSPHHGTLGWLWDDNGDPMPGGDDLDVFKMTLWPGDELQFSLSADEWTDFDMYLSRETSEPGVPEFIAMSDLYRYPESISWIVPEGMGGSYYIELMDVLGDMGDYTLTWSQTNDVTARLFGSERTGTAAAISRSTFATASTVILATSTGYADALAASGLAGTVDAPLLLTPRDYFTPDALSELMRLQPSKIYLVGGTGALSNALMTEATEVLGYAPVYERLSGADRFGTAADVADEIVAMGGTSDSVFLVTGMAFADAVSVAPLAFSQKMPILLTRADELPDPTVGAFASLDPSEMFVIGGTGAVSDEVVSALDIASSPRWGGANRYATSSLVAENAVDEGWATFSHVGFATGTNFPDALAGGTWTGRNDGVLLLTTPTALQPDVAATLTDHADEVEQAVLFGGTGVLSTAVQSAIHAILTAP